MNGEHLLNDCLKIAAGNSLEALVRLACENADMSDYFDDIYPLVKPARQLIAVRQPDGMPFTGRNQLGGMPAVPADFSWPYWEAHPLSFLLQLDCRELTHLQLPGFPDTGIVSFFFCFKNDFSVTDALNNGAGRIYFFPEEGLNEMRPPAGVTSFAPCRLYGIDYPSLPSLGADFTARLWDFAFLRKEQDLGDGYDNVLYELDQLLRLDVLPCHQVGGYPRPVQGTNIEVVMAAAKGFIEKPDYRTIFTEEASAKIKSQQLILQVNEDEEANLHLIDSGKLYFVAGDDRPVTQGIWTFVDFG